jgi:hypothetical protein
MLPVPIATYPDTFFGKFGHAPDRLVRAIIGILVGVTTHASANGGLDRFLM